MMRLWPSLCRGSKSNRFFFMFAHFWMYKQQTRSMHRGFCFSPKDGYGRFQRPGSSRLPNFTTEASVQWKLARYAAQNASESFSPGNNKLKVTFGATMNGVCSIICQLIAIINPCYQGTTWQSVCAHSESQCGSFFKEMCFHIACQFLIRFALKRISAETKHRLRWDTCFRLGRKTTITILVLNTNKNKMSHALLVSARSLLLRHRWPVCGSTRQTVWSKCETKAWNVLRGTSTFFEPHCN